MVKLDDTIIAAATRNINTAVPLRIVIVLVVVLEYFLVLILILGVIWSKAGRAEQHPYHSKGGKYHEDDIEVIESSFLGLTTTAMDGKVNRGHGKNQSSNDTNCHVWRKLQGSGGHLFNLFTKKKMTSFRYQAERGPVLGGIPGVYRVLFMNDNGDTAIDGGLFDTGGSFDWYYIRVTSGNPENKQYLLLDAGDGYFRVAAEQIEPGRYRITPGFHTRFSNLRPEDDPCPFAYHITPFLNETGQSSPGPQTPFPNKLVPAETSAITRGRTTPNNDKGIRGRYYLAMNQSDGSLLSMGPLLSHSVVEIVTESLLSLNLPNMLGTYDDTFYKWFSSVNLLASLDQKKWYVLSQYFCQDCTQNPVSVGCSFLSSSEWLVYPPQNRPLAIGASEPEFWQAWLQDMAGEPVQPHNVRSDPLNPLLYPSRAVFGYFGGSEQLDQNPLLVPCWAPQLQEPEEQWLSMSYARRDGYPVVQFVFGSVYPIHLGTPKEAVIVELNYDQSTFRYVHASSCSGSTESGFRYDNGTAVSIGPDTPMQSLPSQGAIQFSYKPRERSLSVRVVGGNDEVPFRQIYTLPHSEYSLGYVSGASVSNVLLLTKSNACCHGIGNQNLCQDFYYRPERELDPDNLGDKPPGAPACDNIIENYCCPNPREIPDGEGGTITICDKRDQPRYRRDDPLCACLNSDQLWKYGILGLNPHCFDSECYTKGYALSTALTGNCGAFCGNVINIPSGDRNELDRVIQEAHCGELTKTGLGSTTTTILLIGGGVLFIVLLIIGVSIYQLKQKTKQ